MIDTHLHLWRLDTGWYGWNTPALGPVHADSTLQQVAPAMTVAGVDGAVVVQAADTLAETLWLLELARRAPAVLGVVGYLPLADPTALDRWLTARGDDALVGVRQLWHDHDDADDLARTSTVDCLRLVGEHQLSVDVPDACPRLWPALEAVVDRVPGTTFVLDHAGKPPFGRRPAWREWRLRFGELAARPNVVIKLSGLFGSRGSTLVATEEELACVVELTRQHAGAQRTMVGSDWPLTRGSLDYTTTMARLDRLLTGWTPHERAHTLAGTAQRTYGLTLD